METTADTIPLPEDDPAATRIVLKIAHLRPDEVPDIIYDGLLPLDRDQISDDHSAVELAKFCDKYDTASLIRKYIPYDYRYKHFDWGDCEDLI